MRSVSEGYAHLSIFHPGPHRAPFLPRVTNLAEALPRADRAAPNLRCSADREKLSPANREFGLQTRVSNP